MLRWRILLGGVFIATLVGLLALDGRASFAGVWLMPLALIATVLGAGEALGLFAAKGRRPVAWVVYAACVAIVASNWIGVFWPQAGPPLAWPACALGLSLTLVFVGEMRRYVGPGDVTERLALAALAIAYVGGLMSFVVQLRLLGPQGEWGIAALASLVIVVKCGDTGAYTVGRLFGRHRMAPVLSPGKTIEGAIGGLAAACAGAWLALRLLFPWLTGASVVGPWWGWIAFGLVVGIAGMIGDLAESLLKRDAGRKDSSAWMPGFGGVLDIIDSILLGAPAAYLGWMLGWAGG